MNSTRESVPYTAFYWPSETLPGTDSYFVPAYEDDWLLLYGMVGIASSCRFDRERARTSEATSFPYCSASWLHGVDYSAHELLKRKDGLTWRSCP